MLVCIRFGESSLVGEMESVSHGYELRRHEILSRALKAYQMGDPLQRISADSGIGSYELLRLLSTRVADRSEQLRVQALRRRCLETKDVLLDCRDRIQQLLGAGIQSSDIPRILVALGATLDIDIASELLNSPDLLVRPERGQRPFFVTDMMWLRYVTGHHRGLEPDYELALGKIPLPAIHDFRTILAVELSRPQVAQVIALIETTADAISNGDDNGISFSDYEKTRAAIVREFGDVQAPFSPPPAEQIRDRTEGSSWHIALESVGLKFPPVRATSSGADYEDASHSYRSTFGLFGSPKEVASYDSWMIAELAGGRERPSAVAIRRYFGTWESVISAYVPLDPKEVAGMVELYREGNDEDALWARAGELVGEVLATMPWNSFLSIRYGDGFGGQPQPYAQVTPGPDGAWCEIVSEKFLSGDEWPTSANYLLENGWSAPDSEIPNWYREAVPLAEAGYIVLEGLRHGRACPGAHSLQWHTGSFPSRPNPDGGVTVAHVLDGALQTLRNAG
jgi:hypothetical protein